MNWDRASNEELLKQYGRGNSTAFEAFFRRNHRLIFLFLVSRVGNVSDAEEVLQETFFRLHRYIHRYDPGRNALNWVFSIAKNQAATYLSRRKDTTELDESAVEARKTCSLEARDQLEKSLSPLSGEERKLLLEKFLLEESYEEISARRETNPSNIRQKVSRLLKRIRAAQSS